MLSVKDVLGIIDTHKEHSHIEARRWDKWLAWYRSQYWGESDMAGPTGSFDDESDDDLNLETNYPYAFIDTLISNVCPTNPKITCLALSEENKNGAKFREALINHTFYQQRVHRNLWKQATEAALYGRGISKVVWNRRRRRPEINNVDPRHFFYDLSAGRWEDVRYVCEVTVLTQQEFERRKKMKRGVLKNGARRDRRKPLYDAKVAEKAAPTSYPAWLKNKKEDKSMVNRAAQDYFDWVVVYEFYDLIGRKFYHVLDGITEPLLTADLPYRFVKNPFVPLWFNDNLSDLGGLSDVKLIAPAQERLNEIDTLELQHAQASMPYPVINTELCDNPEEVIAAVASASGPTTLIQVAGKQSSTINDIMRWSVSPPLSPSFDKMRARCVGIIEFILGLPAYSRGGVGVADVATELALADSALRTRNGRRIKAVNDVIRAWAERVVGLYEEFLSPDTMLPLRLTDSQEVLQATREDLKFRQGDLFEDVESAPLAWDYEAFPYSPSEQNRLVQLQALQTNLPILLQTPGVDPSKVMMKLLDLLQMRDVASAELGAPLIPGAPGAPGAPGQQVDDAGLPNMLGGELPTGLEPAPPADLPFGGPGQSQQVAARRMVADAKKPVIPGMP